MADNKSLNRISKSNVKFFRFLTAMLSYLFILTGSVLIIHFANQRGNPPVLKMLYYIACALNILQMAFVIFKFIFQQTGHFFKYFNIIENILAALWELVVALEFVFSCVFFHAFRIDSLLITVIQSVAILLMLVYSRRIDFKINKSYNKRFQKDGEIAVRNPSALRKRDITKNILYIVVCIVICGLEFFSLMMPKLPPKIDDIFSPDRVIAYQVYEDKSGTEKGYVVTDIYYGFNDKIVVPLTYNNQPVIGIMSGAIKDLGTINSLQIGEYDKDGVLKSNVRFIEKDAITLNNLTTIDIPQSVMLMGRHAVGGQNLTSVNYYSKSGFDTDAINSPVLKEINLKEQNETVNVTYNTEDIKVNVPSKLYNDYRKKFYDNRKLFEVSDKKENIVIDFETSSQYYLNSQILNKNDAKLNITSLKNKGEETSSLIHDTLIYNKDHLDSEDFESKKGYAFRGWYRDKDYTLECAFTDKDYIYFNEDTTVYAKWNQIKSVVLDWSGFDQADESLTKFTFVSTDEKVESIPFPVLKQNGGVVERNGFNDLSWYYGDTPVSETADLFNAKESTVNIKAKWKLEKPTITYVTKAGGNTYSNNNLSFTFDESQIIQYMPKTTHNAKNVHLNWKLKKVTDGSKLVKEVNTGNGETVSFDLRNVADSGNYLLEVTATADTGEKATQTHNYTITINKKNLNLSSLNMMSPVTRTYNKSGQSLEYSYSLAGKDILVNTEYNINGAFGKTLPVHVSKTPYKVRYTFIKTGVERNNYNPVTTLSSIKIIPKTVSANWATGGSEWTGNQITYNGYERRIRPVAQGVFPGDDVKFIVENDMGRDASSYTTRITGVNNPDYALSPSITDEYTWEIKPKKLNPSWKAIKDTYSGQNIEFVLNLNEIAESDKNFIASEYFTCSTSATKTFDKANKQLKFSFKDAGTKNVKISSFINSNYIFSPVNQDLTIDKSTLSLTWSNTEKTYNGKTQSAKLKIDGFKENDATSILEELFDINYSESYRITEKVGSDITMEFDGKNAKEYPVSVNSITHNNYVLENYNKSNKFIIKPLEIVAEWSAKTFTYDSTEKEVTATVTNLCIDNGVADTVNLSYLNNKGTNAGSKTATFTTTNTNYVVTENCKNSWTINPATLSVNLTGDNNAVYDGKFKTFNVQFSGFKGPDDLSAVSYTNFEFSLNNGNRSLIYKDSGIISDAFVVSFKAIDAGSYSAYLNNLKLDNYVPARSSYGFNINKKELEVKWNYTSPFTYDGATHSVIPEFTNICTRDDTHAKDIVSSQVNSSSKSTAGIYTASIVSVTNQNYFVTTELNKLQWEIKPLVVNMDWQEATFTYDYEYQSIYASINNLANPYDYVYIKYNYFNDAGEQISAPKNAGTYTITVKELYGDDSGNYALPEKTFTSSFVIKPRKLTVNLTKTDGTYNSQSQTCFTATFSGFANNYEKNNFNKTLFNYDTDLDKSAILQSNGTFTFRGVHAGTYKAKITGSRSSNYIIDQTDTLYSTISPVKANISWEETNTIYDGTAKDYSAIITNALYYDKINITYSAESFPNNGVKPDGFNFVDAGTYKIKIESIDNPDYTLNGVSPDKLNHTLTINRKELGITLTPPYYYDSIYNGSYIRYSIGITGIVNKDNNLFKKMPFTYTYNGDRANYDDYAHKYVFDAVNAGSYQIALTGFNPEFNSSNYSITDYVKETNTFTISPKSIGVNWNNGNTYYYDGQIKTMSAKANDYELCTNVLTGVKDKCDLTINNSVARDAGTYESSVTKVSNPNYTVSNSIKNNWTINKRELYVSFIGEKGYTYNGQYHTPQIKITNFVSGDTSLLEIKDFDDTYSNYGYTRLAISDIERTDLSITLGYKTIDAGYYSASVKMLKNKNYNINGNIYTFIVYKKVAEINWGTDTFNYDGTSHLVFAKVANACTRVGSSTPEIVNPTLSRSSITNAGTYSVYVESLNNYNYAVGNDNNYRHTFVVNKKQLSVDWAGAKSHDYDNSPLYSTAIISGFINNDINTSFSFGTNYNYVQEKDSINNYVKLKFSSVNAGAYIYEIYNINSDNYTIANSSYSVSILPKKLSVKWIGNSTFNYDGNTHIVTAEISGFVTTPSQQSEIYATFTGLNSVYTINYSVQDYKCTLSFQVKNVDTYTLSVIRSQNNNYEVDKSLKIVTIKPASLVTEWTDTKEMVNGSEKNIAVLTIKGFYSNDGNNTYIDNFSFSSKPFNITSFNDKIVLKFQLEVGEQEKVIKLEGTNLVNYTIAPSQHTLKV